jgi:hypothetical protein
MEPDTITELQALLAQRPDRAAHLVELARTMVRVGPVAAEMLRRQARGHLVGVKYGDWPEAVGADTGRSMPEEAEAELRDCDSYLMAEELRLLTRLVAVRSARVVARAARFIVLRLIGV